MFHPESHHKPEVESVSRLVVGILEDLEQLVDQEIRLAKAEFEQELAQRTMVLLSIVTGMGLILVASILVSLGAVHALHWSTINSTAEPTLLPLWACHFLVGIIIGSGGLVLVRNSQFRLAKDKSPTRTNNVTEGVV